MIRGVESGRCGPEGVTEAACERFFDLAPDMLCVCGADGYFKRVNPAFHQMLGIDPNEFLKHSIVEFVHPDDRAETIAELEQLSLGRSAIGFKNRYRCADGTYKWLSWRAILDPTEGLIYASAHDVTEQYEAHQRLQALATELSRSNAELEQFAYVASHDLQEPLRAVAGCVQLLQQRVGDLLDGRSKELIAHAVEGATRMQTLISDLLAYSRAGSGGRPNEGADPRAAAERAIAQLRSAIDESHAVVRCAPMPPARADFQQLVQLFQNLIGNAIKFRGAEPPQIDIGGETRDGHSVFWVRDNGIGIEKQYHNRIFGVFQRLHTRQEYPGTGIGLAICKRIVERNGGTIWIESDGAHGSTFFFTLDQGNKP